MDDTLGVNLVAEYQMLEMRDGHGLEVTVSGLPPSAYVPAPIRLVVRLRNWWSSVRPRLHFGSCEDRC